MRKVKTKETLYDRIRHILESAKVHVSRSVNTTQVVANWLVGREIVEEEQGGHARAHYGKKELADLSTRLQAEYGTGYSIQNLRYMRQFYLEYPSLLGRMQIRHTACGESSAKAIRHTVRGEFNLPEATAQICHAPRNKTWKPGVLHPNLAWSNYRHLLKTGKLTHEDLGKLQLYVNYYDRERQTKGDNPTLGLILCAEKNDAVVRYTLGDNQRKQIFASRYKLYLPSEAELRAEIRREIRLLNAPIMSVRDHVRKTGKK